MQEEALIQEMARRAELTLEAASRAYQALRTVIAQKSPAERHRLLLDTLSVDEPKASQPLYTCKRPCGEN